MYSGTSRSLLLNKNSGGQEKESIIRVRVRYNNPSLVMPNGDPQDRFFYPTLILMIDSYKLSTQDMKMILSYTDEDDHEN